MIDAETGRSEVTNVFQFIFFTDVALPPVFPNTYREAMQYLEARRRQESSLEFERVSHGKRWLINPSNYGEIPKSSSE